MTIGELVWLHALLSGVCLSRRYPLRLFFPFCALLMEYLTGKASLVIWLFRSI